MTKFILKLGKSKLDTARLNIQIWPGIELNRNKPVVYKDREGRFFKFDRIGLGFSILSPFFFSLGVDWFKKYKEVEVKERR